VISSSQRPLPQNTQHSQKTNIHASAGFEPTISAGERPQTYPLDCAVTGTSKMQISLYRIPVAVSSHSASHNSENL